MDGARGTGTQALERGLSLLREVAVTDIGGARLADLMARSGLSRSTTHRLLDCLVREEFLRKDAGGRYRLGRSGYDLGLLATHRYEMQGASQQSLKALAASLGETIFLTRRMGLDMVCVERIDGSESHLNLTMKIGTRRPIGIGAGGLALLAALEPQETKAILAANRDRLEEYYGASLMAKLSHRCQLARRNGYAIAGGLRTGGVTGIGIPVRSPKHVPILSLSVVLAAEQLTNSRRHLILAEMRKAAAALALEERS